MLFRLSKFTVPVAIFGAFLYVYVTPYNNWSGFEYIALTFALAIYIAITRRGRIRDISVIAATLTLGLAGIEAYSIAIEAQPIDFRSRGYSVSRPILGWGPERPGVYHQTKIEARTHQTIYDVDYTIDNDRNRKVDSARSNVAVAFFGDSATFGTGLPDTETLPQLFADLYDRKIHVMNFGFPGYGPQQFLRALETDIFDELLNPGSRLFVFETAVWHSERSSCLAGWMLRAPRYEMVNGRAVFHGTCIGRWATMLKQLFANTALYRVFFGPALGGPSRADVDLYIGILARAGELAREKYDAPTLILYMRSDANYLRPSGYTDDEIMQHMRAAGLDVIDVSLNPADFPGRQITFPNDGHPTALANSIRATMTKAYIERERPGLFAQIGD